MGKKKVKSMVYYDLLAIEADATPEQIKKAYRKKALQLHPDKRGNTPEAQEEFTLMKQAYDVISDPQKREVYDQAGEDGIKLMENYGSMGPEELAAALFASLGAFGPKGKCLLILVITCLFSFFLIIPIFWCLRVDQTIHWSWIVVFTPLWILDTIYYCCYGCATLSSDASLDPEDQHNRPSLLYRIYKLLKALLLLVLQIFIAMKLNGDLNWSVIEVLLPYFVYDSLSFIETIVGGFIGYQMLTKQSEGAGVSTTEAIQQQRRALINNILVQLLLIISRLVQGVLIGLRVDDKLGHTSWWVVFTPVWLYVLYFCSHPIRRYFRAIAKRKENANKPKQPPAPPQHDAYTRDSVHDHDEDETSKNPMVDAFCSILFIAIVVSPYFILSTRLQNASFSTLYILLPWFIIVGLVLCFICCAIACIRTAQQEDEEFVNGEDVRSPNHDNVPV